MERLRKFLRLPARDRNLLASAALLVGAIRLGLWLVPFRTLRRLLLKITQAARRWPVADEPSAHRVVWAVAAVSRYVPATCLTQALAAQVMLSRRGQPAHLRIGVVKSERGQLEAHAWVELEGRIVMGGVKDLLRFNPMPPLDGEQL